MLINIVTKRRFKVIAVFLVVNLIAQIGFPTVAFALTSGPSQPEAGSFEPVNTNQMVDLFSGDFTYNIPLMNVPGPNGGYPINIAYNAGIGMEQEATWVGLGWNINPGAINRNLRGVPDDFSGDQISKTLNMRPQRNLSFGIEQVNTEIFGFDAGKGFGVNAQVSLYYDNYKGVGMNYGLSFATKSSGAIGGPMQGSFSITSDTKEGLGVSPSLSYASHIKNKGFAFELGLGFNSRQGLNRITFGVKEKNYKGDGIYKGGSGPIGAAPSFSSSTYVPTMDMPRGGFSGDFNLKIGPDLAGVDPSPLNFNVRYNESRILKEIMEFGGYGYLYAQNNTEGHNIADFNREKDIPVNKNSKSLPVPSATYDVYTVKGQGVGGAFRTYRSDIGIFKDPKINSKTGGGGFGLEVNTSTGATYKFGYNPKLIYNTSYSGGWQSHAGEVEADYQFQGNTTDDAYEPAYFKALGEMVPDEDISGGNQNTNNEPFRFDIKMVRSGGTNVPVVRDFVSMANSSQRVSGVAKTSVRTKRVQSIEYLTKLEKTSSAYTNSYTTLTIPINYDTAAIYGSAPAHHIGEMSVVNPDGNRYVYGLPAYNTHQEDVMFAVDGGETVTTGRLRSYNTSEENTRENDRGLTNLYSKTVMPAYAHSYMLTAVLSPDYVDLTGNGPSYDDLGYWVKFNYIKRDSYSWRTPYEANKGNNIENNYSDNMDDMSGYSYGTKEIMYLQSIETKTHVAEYYLSERLDGLSSAGINGGQGSEKLLKLDSIVLRSKADLATAIKTVHFEYDYSLCENTPNSTGTNGAKLTLKKIWFTYLNNSTKGALSPYKFVYADVDHDGTEDANPSYNIEKMDRWGNYQAVAPFDTTSGYKYPNHEYAYCNQFDDYNSAGERDKQASAWNLTKITMPSGGELTIDYESDDYAYVQNKKAMQMYEITGTGDNSGLNSPSGTKYPLTNDDDRIYIQLSKAVDAVELNRMIEGVEQVYFKTYIKLKNFHNTSTPAYDYVEGYAKLISISSATGSFPTSSAYIRVENVPPHQIIQSEVHPIKMAGLREIRFNRSDLLSGQNTGLMGSISPRSIAPIAFQLLNTVLDAVQLLSGFYNYGIMAGWCDEIDVNDTYPSYIRLNSEDGIKYGGGSRVKNIDLYDSWEELNSANYESSSYGQVYDYSMIENGDTISSGVAQYEPLIGGEENPFRQPVRYSSDRMIIKDDALMVEEPFNESLYPSANVGYSRVTVRNKTQNDGTYDVKKAVSGITVNEFYTARDYPVYAKNTDVDYAGYNLTIPVPFIGSYVHHNNGYSQGYAIELNDMHGKPYSVATYAPPLNDADPQPGAPGVEPIAATYYYYKTEGTFVKNSSVGNKLSNEVTVLTGDAIKTTEEIGKHVDTYVDMRENKTTSTSLEILPNVNGALFVIFPNAVPTIDNSYSMFRSVTTNKVITRNGILDKQVTTKEGARTVTENVYYDAETGSPLMTTTTNDFDNPIYDYSYAAHWEHEGMKGAYNNVGAIVSSSTNDLVKPGDELLQVVSGVGTKYWVEHDGSVTNAAGSNSASISATAPDYIKIVRSGYRNQQAVPSGNIVALSDPTGGRNFQLFTTVNALTLSSTNPTPTNTDIIVSGNDAFVDCFSQGEFTVSKISVCSLNVNRLLLKVPECTVTCDNLVRIDCSTECETWVEIDGVCYCEDETTNCEDECDGAFQGVEFASTVDLTETKYVFDSLTLTKYGNKVKANFGTQTEIWGELKGLECLNECIDGVLHASSAKFKPLWGTTDHADAGTGITPAFTSTTRYGIDNIWRLHETYLFDIDRKQSALGAVAQKTKTGEDGTYDNFVLFNWSSLSLNLPWTKTNTINQYSPYGYELENEDALGIKSSALYGYKNSVVTAVASNTAYNELVFDGFEDYVGNSYAAPSSNYGHLQLVPSVTSTSSLLSSTQAHSGDYSIKLAAGENAKYNCTIENGSYSQFNPKRDRDYYVSVWVYVTGTPGTGSATLTAKVNGSTVLTQTTSTSDQKIEGWQRLEGKFTTTSTIGHAVEIKVESASVIVYLDDIRVQPFKSAMKSYVYDPQTLWLKAELDDRNYATFYNYDEEGNLVQIKKETQAGLRTIVSNRKNVKQN